MDLCEASVPCVSIPLVLLVVTLPPCAAWTIADAASCGTRAPAPARDAIPGKRDKQTAFPARLAPDPQSRSSPACTAGTTSAAAAPPPLVQPVLRPWALRRAALALPDVHAAPSCERVVCALNCAVHFVSLPYSTRHTRRARG